ncbi:MAG: hypothetical protein EHM70_00755 [Chloroflexota bacterium]|nr:MAG: hypothetical protein EHM70_00755 [Chloroflexota bacterium]
MRVLIVGGTGQISRAISRIFLEAGEDLTLYHRGRTTSKQVLVIYPYFFNRSDDIQHVAFAAQQQRLGQPAGFPAGLLANWAVNLAIARIL